MSWNPCHPRAHGPTCSRCGRQHPPPPPPGRTPTLTEDGREHHADGSLQPYGTWARLVEDRLRAWCSSWRASA